MNGPAVSLCRFGRKSGSLVIAAVILPFAVLNAQNTAPITKPQLACSLAPGEVDVTVSGSVSDSTGARVAGARVIADCGSLHRETRTNAGGAFSFTLPLGTFRFRFEAPNLAPVDREFVVSAEAGHAELNVNLSVAQVKSHVTVSAEAGYVAVETESGTKTETSLLEVPQSISIVTRQLLDDQGAVKLDDALKNVAGVSPGGYYDNWDYYRIRGFDASFNTYVDGLRGANGLGEEIFNLQDVEVLKGPSSMLYGQSVLGGLINLRSKHPRPDAFANVQFTGGQFGFLEPAVDAGASLNPSQTVFARLVAFYRNQDSYVDYAYSHRTFVAPSLTWKITPATTVTFLGRYERDHIKAPFPLPAAGTVLPNPNGEIPTNRFTGEPDAGNLATEKNKQFGYEFNHQFNDRLSVYQNLRLTWYDQNWDRILYSGFLVDDRTLYRYPLSWFGNRHDLAVDNGIRASLKTGAIRHSLLFGVDFFREPSHFLGESIDFSDPTFSGYMPIDLFNPVYGTPLTPIAPYTQGDTRQHYLGVYLQDQVKLTERLALTAGGRLDFASNHDLAEPDSSDNHAFSPRVGLTYQLHPGVAAFSSFSKSFYPQSGRIFVEGTEAGKFVTPETGQQWEGGIKTSLLGGRVGTTVSVYHLQRQNVITSDLSHPNFYQQTGKQRSRGVEFETAFRLMTGWNVTLAYAFTDAIVTEDEYIPVGTRTQNSPRNTVNAWITYEVQRGPAKGLGFGFGGRHYTDQSGDLVDTFNLPGFGVFDASAFYRRGRFRWQINANNLANNRYFVGSYDALYVKPGEPRNIRTTIGWMF